MMLKILFFTTIFIAGAIATPQSCYYCIDSDSKCIDGDASAIHLKMNCSTFLIQEKTSLAITRNPQISNIIRKIDKDLSPAFKDEFFEPVCLSFKFKQPASPEIDIAWRSCMPKEILGRGICHYMETIFGGAPEDCEICSETDCNANSASPVFASLVLASVLFLGVKLF